MALRALLGKTQPKPLTDRQRRIYSFLQSQHVGVLSTVTPDRNPHGAVIYYLVDNELTVWFVTKKSTRKYDNIRHNNHVMLTVFEPHSQTTAQILGKAIEHSSETVVSRVCDEIFKNVAVPHEHQLPPIVKVQAGALTAFAIKPVDIKMAVYSKPDPDDHEQLFESVESFGLNQN